ncbi:MAG: TIGR03016 family PEP-CTERM system-associated outer membrane protein [Azoarcus sp.]|jgi:uncharacterized protein (PEP-CTERM system associated)|nr:TIGR03016 family PEP-CTERM system-associated outer membrane protein [Azoarcus sp.]
MLNDVGARKLLLLSVLLAFAGGDAALAQTSAPTASGKTSATQKSSTKAAKNAAKKGDKAEDEEKPETIQVYKSPVAPETGKGGLFGVLGEPKKIEIQDMAAQNYDARRRPTVWGDPNALNQGLRIKPRVDAYVGWTDNARTKSKKSYTNDEKKRDWIAEIAPGLNISSTRGRFVGMFDATWRSLAYRYNDDLNESFATVHGAGTLEAVKDALFVDFGANVDRQERDAMYGADNGSRGIDKSNETRGWTVGPRWQFRLGAAADGMVRYRSTFLSGNSLEYKKSREQEWAANLGKPDASRRLGWNLEYSRYASDFDYRLGDDEEIERDLARATLYFNLARTFRLRATGGYESYDDGHDKKDSKAIGGGGFDWTPTPRTKISTLVEKRVFGTGYDITVSHRMRRVLFEISGVRDISTLRQSLGLYSDPRYAAALARNAGIADAVLRDRFIRSELGYPLEGDYSSSYYQQTTWRAGMTFTGLRNTLSVSGVRSRYKRLTTIGSVGFENEIDSDAAALMFTHLLTPLTTLELMAMRSRMIDYRFGSPDEITWRTTASLGVNTRLGPQARAGLYYHYQHSNTNSAQVEDDYTENAIRANFGVSF